MVQPFISKVDGFRATFAESLKVSVCAGAEAVLPDLDPVMQAGEACQLQVVLPGLLSSHKIISDAVVRFECEKLDGFDARVKAPYMQHQQQHQKQRT